MAGTLPPANGLTFADPGLRASPLGLAPNSYRIASEQIFDRFDLRDPLSGVLEAGQSLLANSTLRRPSNAERSTDSNLSLQPSSDERIFRRNHLRIDRENALDELFASLDNGTFDQKEAGTPVRPVE
jgi:hypothetical protein